MLATLQLDAYPIDGGESTGMPRLVMLKPKNRDALPAGGKWPLENVQLRLENQRVVIPESDPVLQQQILEMLGEDKDHYGFAVLDLSNLNAPVFAEYRGDTRFNPGSVGKLLVGLSLFQTLADRYPNDIEARRKYLSETILTADPLIMVDDHDVAIVDPATNQLVYRPLQIGDQGNMWTYLDWMFSASSNAASAMVVKEMILLRELQANYTAMRPQADEYLKQRKKSELGKTLTEALQQPVISNGLDGSKLQQGGFFTRAGKQAVPGANSYATPTEFIRFLLKMEQGQLVDQFSSVELKRLMYLTQKRIRYASSPALSKEALYFKSGSLYRCKPEVDFKCRKYQGNVENLLNSVAIVESAKDAANPLYYYVVITSNVLRKNSAVAHQTLATKIHRLIQARHHSPSEVVPQK